MVVDARTELASPDYDLVRLLGRSSKPVFLAVNKIEGEAMAYAAENFRQLGIKEVYAISAEHGLGIGDLLDADTSTIPEPIETPAESDTVDSNDSMQEEKGQPRTPSADVHRTHGEFEQHETAIAIICRPYVVNSSLLYAQTNTTHANKTLIAGTTRDAVDETVEYEGDT